MNWFFIVAAMINIGISVVFVFQDRGETAQWFLLAALICLVLHRLSTLERKIDDIKRWS